MDSDQRLLDDYTAREEAREADDRRRRRADLQRYENAAKAAHKVRMTAHFAINSPVPPPWDDLQIGSKQQLIADAEVVAMNPSITEPELRRLYRERLTASGDTDNPDLGTSDEISDSVETMVLADLRATLRSAEPAA